MHTDRGVERDDGHERVNPLWRAAPGQGVDGRRHHQNVEKNHVPHGQGRP